MTKRYIPACTTEGPAMAVCSDEYEGPVWYSEKDFKVLLDAVKCASHHYLCGATYCASCKGWLEESACGWCIDPITGGRKHKFAPKDCDCFKSKALRDVGSGEY